MGRTGPAFLAYANFAAYTEWNNSLIYSTTAAYLATRIAGAGPIRKPATPVAQLQFNEIKELQQLLAKQDSTSARSTAFSANRAALRSRPCRQSTACLPTHGRLRNC
jgi:hypothetical protein